MCMAVHCGSQGRHDVDLVPPLLSPPFCIRSSGRCRQNGTRGDRSPERDADMLTQDSRDRGIGLCHRFDRSRDEFMNDTRPVANDHDHLRPSHRAVAIDKCGETGCGTGFMGQESLEPMVQQLGFERRHIITSSLYRQRHFHLGSTRVQECHGLLETYRTTTSEDLLSFDERPQLRNDQHDTTPCTVHLASSAFLHSDPIHADGGPVTASSLHANFEQETRVRSSHGCKRSTELLPEC